MEAPEDLHGGLCVSDQLHLSSQKPRISSEHFTVDDLLDFSSDERVAEGDEILPRDAPPKSPQQTTVAPFENSGANACFSERCYIPEEIAELEWLSYFLEESHACQHFQKLSLAPRNDSQSATSSSSSCSSSQNPNRAVHLSGKIETKRNRAISHLVHLSLENSGESAPAKRPKKVESSEEGRRCVHCDTDRTPQWRAGPMGPKTLCNACGVRYKSGRLVPEYRPAASPTFSLSEHSNSHRKVLELRRVKEQHETSRTGEYRR